MRAYLVLLGCVAVAACVGCIHRSTVYYSTPVTPDGKLMPGELLYYLPRTMFKVTLTRAEPKAKEEYPVLDLALEAVRVPDPKAAYVLTRNDSSWYTKELSVKVNEQGLLSSVTTKNTDVTVEVVAEVAKAVPLAVQAAGGFAPKAVRAGVPPPDKRLDALKSIPPGKHVFVFDPSIANGEMPPQDVPGTAGLVKVAAVMAGAGSASSPASAHERQGGIVARGLAPASVTATVLLDKDELTKIIRLDKPDAAAVEKDSVELRAAWIVDIPDYASTVVVPVERGSFTTSERKVVLTGGVVTEAGLIEPSPMVQIASLPVVVLSEIVKVPAEMLQLKVNLSPQEKEAAAAQKAAADAQAALKAAVDKLASQLQELRDSEAAATKKTAADIQADLKAIADKQAGEQAKVIEQLQVRVKVLETKSQPAGAEGKPGT